MERLLREILVSIDPSTVTISGSPGIEVRGLAYDSRDIRPGFLFFALPGLHSDGHDFIGRAVEAGASCVVHEKPLTRSLDGVASVRVPDARFAMSPIASAFYGHPSDSLVVIGVTGTEGKSTTVYLAYQLLDLAGERAGFFSTVRHRLGADEVDNPEHQTTPEAPVVQRMLADMRDYGMRYAVVEASSHGLSPRLNRLGDVAFDVGVFMNVTHEHLEFHGTWEQYRDDKANLFRALDLHSHRKIMGGVPVDVPSFGVVNGDEPSAAYFRQATRRSVRAYSGKGNPAELSATAIEPDARGNSFLIVEGETRMKARIELPGAFNVDNVLAALLAVSGSTGRPVADFVPLLPQLKPVRGRMTVVDRGQLFEVLVDYAHTPSSFVTIFPPIRKRAPGRIISLFGSGGERDTAKRPQQGRIAADFSDIVILSDEDPRGEVPERLLEMIAAGCPEKKRGEELFLIPDRPTALRKAFSLAGPGDIVLLLGKGHENSIIYRDGPVPYDEIGEAEKALAELGYRQAQAPVKEETS
ncbi:MAG: UDP-N-acetylmuramoyl-L-alanyl-D-glutamate--2,6-diaminopimelate ligase [Spirochaetes bacterium]|nr:UDP-N-acetylmuramoyl-L-alanyl-D-glutamate--2,6-diaminopimelate ligase [Spirochaetota bacterium]